MLETIRDFMVAKACKTVVSVDATDEFSVGEQFSFDILAKPEAETAREIIERVLEKVAYIDLPELIQYSPYTVEYIAKGCPTDIVCKDSEGDHFMMPSGVLVLIRKCENGDFPPVIPTKKPETKTAKSPEDIVSDFMERMKKAS